MFKLKLQLQIKPKSSNLYVTAIAGHKRKLALPMFVQDSKTDS